MEKDSKKNKYNVFNMTLLWDKTKECQPYRGSGTAPPLVKLFKSRKFVEKYLFNRSIS